MLQSVVNINNDIQHFDRNNPYYNLIPVQEGDIHLIIRNKKFRIEIIKCYHTVPCVGYGFIEIRNKLKNEYTNLTQSDIGVLRKSGINVSHEVEHPTFCYLGDTSKDILNDPKIQKYKNIMIECTFIDNTYVDQADKTLHMHWDYLKDYIQNHQDITSILYHFSQRYKRSHI